MHKHLVENIQDFLETIISNNLIEISLVILSMNKARSFYNKLVKKQSGIKPKLSKMHLCLIEKLQLEVMSAKYSYD